MKQNWDAISRSIHAPHRTIAQHRLIAAAKEQMFGLGNAGFCRACGHEQDGCEPDARNYECECCGEHEIFGASELLLMGEEG